MILSFHSSKVSGLLKPASTFSRSPDLMETPKLSVVIMLTYVVTMSSRFSTNLGAPNVSTTRLTSSISAAPWRPVFSAQLLDQIESNSNLLYKRHTALFGPPCPFLLNDTSPCFSSRDWMGRATYSVLPWLSSFTERPRPGGDAPSCVHLMLGPASSGLYRDRPTMT